MSETYEVGGVDLGRWQVTRGTTYRPATSTSRSSVNVPGRHGAIPVGLPTFEVPQVTLKLSPFRDGKLDAGVQESEVDMLTALLASPAVKLRRTIGGVTVEAEARLVSLDFPAELFRFGRWATVTAVLELPGVFWRDTTVTELSLPAGSSTLTELAGTAPIADAVVQWASASGTASVTDSSTRTSISVRASGAATVDVGRMQAWASTSWTRSGSSLNAAIDYAGPGPLQLWPSQDKTSRAVKVNSTHACKIRARRAWL